MLTMLTKDLSLSLTYNPAFYGNHPTGDTFLFCSCPSGYISGSGQDTLLALKQDNASLSYLAAVFISRDLNGEIFQAAFPNGPQSGPTGAQAGPNLAQLGPNRGPHGMLLGNSLVKTIKEALQKIPTVEIVIIM